MRLSKLVAAIAALLFLAALAQPAEARQQNQNIITCDQRGCSDWFKVAKGDAGERRVKHRRSPARDIQIDKTQEYAAVGPNGKLEKREVYEAKSGIVRSAKTGASTRVSPKYARAFQGFIDDLEAGGAVIKFLGGYRSGKCWQGGKHPCGMALDYCQYARGVVDKRCNLPGRAVVASIARKHGLFEGGQWCSSDYGHVEAGGSTACGKSWNPYAEVQKIEPSRYADSRNQGNGSLAAVLDDGSRRGKYKSMKERRKALALQRHAAMTR